MRLKLLMIIITGVIFMSDSFAGSIVLISTNNGDIKVELFDDKAPKTVENFLSYVKDGYYNGTIFHRVIPGFMIQGGGLDDKYKNKQGKNPIENEADNGLLNIRGTIAMARTMDPHSATSQFFINTVDNKSLNYTSKTPQGWGYAVFGKVIEGMDVVDKISQIKTGRVAGHTDVPRDTVIIENVKVLFEESK